MRKLFSLLLLLAPLTACSAGPVARAAPETVRTAVVPRTPRPATPPALATEPAPPTATAEPAPPSPTPAPSPTPGPPPLLGGEPAPRMSGELAMVTYSLDLYRLNGAMPAEAVQRLGLDAEQAIASGGAILGGELTGRVAVRFEPPQSGPCALRGITLSNERTIRLFYPPDADETRVRGILAHELFHQLQHDYYGERDHRKADTILLEGMAVWGTGAYFPGQSGRPLYHERAKQAQAEGRLLPLTTSLEADCRTTTRNDIYNQWASFVEYLSLTYGREKLDAAYRSSTGRPAGSARWQQVYGAPLTALERDWAAWLSEQP